MKIENKSFVLVFTQIWEFSLLIFILEKSLKYKLYCEFLKKHHYLFKWSFHWRITILFFINRKWPWTESQCDSILHLYCSLQFVASTMSVIRLCGVLTKSSLLSSQQRLPVLVPIAFKLKDSQSFKQQFRGFKNLGHKPTPEPKVSQYFNAFVGIIFFSCLLDWRG